MQTFYEDYLNNLDELHNDIEKALEGLTPAALDWVPQPGMNSIGVMVFHLTGAERYWIGDVIAGDNSNRDRDAEFKAKGMDMRRVGEAPCRQSFLYHRSAGRADSDRPGNQTHVPQPA